MACILNPTAPTAPEYDVTAATAATAGGGSGWVGNGVVADGGSVLGKYPICDKTAYNKFALNLGYLTSAAFEDPNDRILEWAAPVQGMVRNTLMGTTLRKTIGMYPKTRLYVSKKDKVWIYFGSEDCDKDGRAYTAFGVCIANYVDTEDRGLEITDYKVTNCIMQKKTDFTSANCKQQAKWAAFQVERDAKRKAVEILNACGVPIRQVSTVLTECTPKKRKQCDMPPSAVVFQLPKLRRQKAMITVQG